MPLPSNKRRGLLAGGNFIMDHVKIIDAWPEQEMLVNILRETSSNGGGPYNVLRDLSLMETGFQLEAAGLVGQDANGDWILRDCKAAGIDTRQLHQTDEAPTSYTDAMTVERTGRRTFFHQRGANALLGLPHFDFTQTKAKIFHLGYLMLLDEMDRLQKNGRSISSLVLEKAQREGLLTSVDAVSTENPRFRDIAEAALPYTDYLIINEIEAGKMTSTSLRAGQGVSPEACVEAGRKLLQRGVKQHVIIHFVEGSVAVSKSGQVTMQPSLRVPPDAIVGATGAGDAFAAGCLLGLHDDWPMPELLMLAASTAAACLSHATPSLGLRPVEECTALARRFGFREMAGF